MLALIRKLIRASQKKYFALLEKENLRTLKKKSFCVVEQKIIASLKKKSFALLKKKLFASLKKKFCVVRIFSFLRGWKKRFLRRWKRKFATLSARCISLAVSPLVRL